MLALKKQATFRSLTDRAVVILVALAWSSLAFCGEIHDAAKNDDLAKVKALLKDNPALVSSKDEHGSTALHWGALRGHKDMVELLLANKADVNAKDNTGWTPLHLAAQEGYKDIVELLLANKADVNAKQNNDETPLFLATALGHMDVAELLRQHGGNTGARVTVPEGQIIHLDHPLHNGDTFAAMGGNSGIEIIGQNPSSAETEMPKTPLMAAAGKGDTDGVKALIAGSADVNALDHFGALNYGHTALMYASGAGNTNTDSDCVKTLIAAHADVNVKDCTGKTALMFASETGKTDSVKALIAAHADVNAKDNSGKTALMWAGTGTGKPVPEIVAVLKAAGATQ